MATGHWGSWRITTVCRGQKGTQNESKCVCVWGGHRSCLCGALLNEMELNGADTFTLHKRDSKLQAAPTAAVSRQL